MEKYEGTNIFMTTYDTKNPIDVAMSIKDELVHQGKWDYWHINILEMFPDNGLLNDFGKEVWEYLKMMHYGIATNKGCPKEVCERLCKYLKWLYKHDIEPEERFLYAKKEWEANNKFIDVKIK